MEAVLRDYLSFSRPLEDLRIGAVDLAEIANTVVVLLEGRATEAGIRLQLAARQRLAEMEKSWGWVDEEKRSAEFAASEHAALAPGALSRLNPRG